MLGSMRTTRMKHAHTRVPACMYRRDALRKTSSASADRETHLRTHALLCSSTFNSAPRFNLTNSS
eukprot:2019564-Pleurochrysis_carterae.AAC.2